MSPSIKAIAAFLFKLFCFNTNFELLSLTKESYEFVLPPPIDLSILLKSTNN